MMDSNTENQLKETFEEFIKTSEELRLSYETLKQDSELLSSYLSNILNNLDSSILVFDTENILKLWNSSASILFPGLNDMEETVTTDILNRNSNFNIDELLSSANTKLEIKVENSSKDSWYEVKILDFINKDDQKAGRILMFEDITELKYLQIKSQQEERLRVMGELAAEVAHEIRNPLGSIELMVSLLEEDLKNSGSNEILNRIRSSVNNMNHTVTNILIYTRELKPVLKEVSLPTLLTETESMLVNTLSKKKIKVEKDLELSELSGDQELLKQAVANIMLNAAEAMESEGTITVHSSAGDKDFILKISDNGPGIPQDTLEGIFKPFFTTKNTGTGLGLAMTKRVIEAHEGTIEASSSENGACFTIKLPIK